MAGRISHIFCLERWIHGGTLAPHTLYAAIAIRIIGVLRGLRYSPKYPHVSLSSIQFADVAGLKLAGLGCSIEIIAGVWIEIVHGAFLNEPRIASALALSRLGC